MFVVLKFSSFAGFSGNKAIDVGKQGQRITEGKSEGQMLLLERGQRQRHRQRETESLQLESTPADAPSRLPSTRRLLTPTHPMGKPSPHCSRYTCSRFNFSKHTRAEVQGYKTAGGTLRSKGLLSTLGSSYWIPAPFPDSLPSLLSSH